MTDSKVWLRPPWGNGEPKEFEATPDVLTPLLKLAGASASRQPKSGRFRRMSTTRLQEVQICFGSASRPISRPPTSSRRCGA